MRRGMEGEESTEGVGLGEGGQGQVRSSSHRQGER